MEFSLGQWQPVADRVWVAVAEPASVNIGLVVGDRAVLVVDTGSSPEQGAMIAASAAEHAGRPVTHVVVTHDHFDHFWGLAGFGSEVVSIAHESAHLPTGDGREVPDGPGEPTPAVPEGLAAATTTVAMVKAIDLGGARAEIIHHGRGHTQGDLVVHLPERDVVFTGDLVEVGAEPSFGPDSTVETWAATLDGMLGATLDSTRFVPGHGSVVDKQVVFEQRANVSTIYGQAEQLVGRGIRLDQALEALDTPEIDGRPHPGASQWDWPYSARTIRTALPLAYAELAAKGLEPRTSLPLLGRL
ncbi:MULTISPECIES: MBL fold metallo-hydrolase [Aestuariimicrobium]|uniref:MBL fold metallo-hydrolase n=1 Tax=Aestuariimicrobium TaxID=396388 RepID=UPI0003B50AFC|nr:MULTISPECIES: MBL fold metallo-hydrolase [Aestuariimicrobium]CAI9411309.1 Hydroxyacylglutathione hydrolase [Aestuariimicrobium sp. T2.26MG-19.2B]